MAELVPQYNHTFSTSHRCWFLSLYKDKYEYMGEFDLMDLAYRLDLGLYYWGVVRHPFEQGATALHTPPFATGQGFVFMLMSTYNRRFAQIARCRRRRKELGRLNRNHRSLITGFKIHRNDAIKLFGMLAEWALLELREGWRSWGESADDVTASHLPVQTKGTNEVTPAMA